MGNLCTCCDPCRDGLRQDFEPKKFISIPHGSKTDTIEVDFHNFTVASATKLLHDLFDRYKDPTYHPEVKYINLIVGAGNHCEEGAKGRKIYPIVYEEAKNSYSMYSLKDHEKNHGIVVATRINVAETP
ncbi:hypothetical protein TVAG_411280 [Trichomonas vaginalis G3]|uniref:Smr domain-containing protein n=1 Tax=Trichomonas vaginalis (strain ATCC PRA-98 / G3) TaxID=412133 RepID=A2DXN3_TRIV3|nr:SMR domain-like family [Trichomonas vaginalis G3]EAY14862.1 hypothetical protein TVAG_411280 [Trichomonas vaginalis G3]KAI5541157.1 SMR domain-like family [Trichomonas vaginalis G3]|eukprot:XP_001327085.1 hypothetical protein [Trichomonas vaginalis G3]